MRCERTIQATEVELRSGLGSRRRRRENRDRRTRDGSPKSSGLDWNGRWRLLDRLESEERLEKRLLSVEELDVKFEVRVVEGSVDARDLLLEVGDLGGLSVCRPSEDMSAGQRLSGKRWWGQSQDMVSRRASARAGERDSW